VGLLTVTTISFFGGATGGRFIGIPPLRQYFWKRNFYALKPGQTLCFAQNRSQWVSVGQLAGKSALRFVERRELNVKNKQYFV
jgi:hypothetical protein